MTTVPAAASSSTGAPRASRAQADALRTLVLSTGTGNWQHKSEVLGFGHTAKQVNNKWRSLASSDPMLSLVVRVGDGDGDGSGAQAAASGGARSSPHLLAAGVGRWYSRSPGSGRKHSCFVAPGPPGVMSLAPTTPQVPWEPFAC